MVLDGLVFEGCGPRDGAVFGADGAAPGEAVVDLDEVVVLGLGGVSVPFRQTCMLKGHSCAPKLQCLGRKREDRISLFALARLVARA